ncbi:DNA-binding transcriptional regulator, AcrR family [Halobacillus karajensis]|uniref:HTH-type transcriptional regulator RutR n=1 Tax=Halobacillus karajensis TaxID=195088 RepID=A0A024P8M3_9BACI|nr:HTH-type transcriptional regulator RutR [Halobacillus karajensis]CDQ25265.1 HTH-type transcriptional regulator RutR [Halobacillus karajensis]CDQ28374.1 HTH-type transcriptional regulator RutR [Halobacillus karajensis]SEI00205.1 DNA-binding transcriptional regulator, AcrR family [Halobacillus karajensis]
MPLQLYDKEKILEAFLVIFARHGYEKTSTGMLAEAAGISKPLVFHHFKSKKALYLSVLDYCFETLKAKLSLTELSECVDFFEAKEKISLIKLEHFQKNPHAYKVTMEAFTAPPPEVSTEIKEKYGEQLAARDQFLKQLFEKVPLRDGVNREQAFELIMMTMKHFEKKIVSDLNEHVEFDTSYNQRLLEERNRFLDMIRHGIER